MLPKYPRLEIFISDLFHPRFIESPRLINALTEHQVLVTNAFLRIVHGGWDVRHFTNSDSKQLPELGGIKEHEIKQKDYWLEEGDQIVEVHMKKRTKLFDPRESPHPDFPEHMFKDKQRTLRVQVDRSLEIKGEEWNDRTDNWRIGGMSKENHERIEWAGRTVFEKRTRKLYLSAPSVGQESIKKMRYSSWTCDKR